MLDSLEGKKVYSIGNEYISEIENEIERLNSMKDNLDKDTYDAQLKGRSTIKKICDGLKKYAKANGVEPDYVFLKSTQFSSGFAKPDFSNINILFIKDGEQILRKFSKIVATFSSYSDNKDYYYIYSKHIIKRPVENKYI